MSHAETAKELERAWTVSHKKAQNAANAARRKLAACGRGYDLRDLSATTRAYIEADAVGHSWAVYFVDVDGGQKASGYIREEIRRNK